MHPGLDSQLISFSCFFSSCWVWKEGVWKSRRVLGVWCYFNMTSLDGLIRNNLCVFTSLWQRHDLTVSKAGSSISPFAFGSSPCLWTFQPIKNHFFHLAFVFSVAGLPRVVSDFRRILINAKSILLTERVALSFSDLHLTFMLFEPSLKPLHFSWASLWLSW